MSMHPERNLFKEFFNPYYVETGGFTGDSIQLAIDAGFRDVRSIEVKTAEVLYCRLRFMGQPVSVFEGDSAEMLWDVIKDIPGPITFWLDSHWQMLEGEQPGKNPWPLQKELEQIKRHPIKTHTIMVDDMWYLSHPYITGWGKTDIELWLYDINPDYKIEYFANPVINNILIAHV